jgi:hypothetical protein
VSQQINLYYEESHAAGKDLSALNMLQGAVVIAMAVVAYYAYTFYQLDELQQQIDGANSNLVVQQDRLKSLTGRPAGMTIEQELKQAETELLAQGEIVNALKNGEIGNTQGYSDYMQAFAKQALGGLWLTGFSIVGDAAQMRISGATVNPELVPAYILGLNREKIMRGKTFASLQMQLPKTEDGQAQTAQYLEFVLQSAGKSEAEKK